MNWLPCDDQVEFDGTAGVEVDGHHLRLSAEQVQRLAVFVAQQQLFNTNNSSNNSSNSSNNR